MLRTLTLKHMVRSFSEGVPNKQTKKGGFKSRTSDALRLWSILEVHSSNRYLKTFYRVIKEDAFVVVQALFVLMHGLRTHDG